MALEAFCLKGRVDDHRLPSDGHSLGVARATLGLVRRADLSRRFRQHIEAVETRPGRVRQIDLTALGSSAVARVFVEIPVREIRQLVQSQQDALAIPQRNGLAPFNKVICQAIDAALGELLSAGLAGVLVAVTGILQLLPADEEL